MVPVGYFPGSSGIHPTFNLQYIRRVKVLSKGFDLLDDFGIPEPSKKKVKLTYRSIDSEWEPTKKYE